ncbi:MAG: hypothetical protein M3133_03465 [Actinomycetota bacterium]|nr:hypothetical protein [Actinomycetota bacterium]
MAEVHQSGCHRWHSCPSDTGSYVCGDLGYACQYANTPAPTLRVPERAPDDDEYITKAEFRLWAKQSIRDEYGDRPRRFFMRACLRLDSATLSCRVYWSWRGHWKARLAIRENRYTFTPVFGGLLLWGPKGRTSQASAF